MLTQHQEHHLQAVISSQAAGSGNSAYIPTPPTNLSGVQYDRLYRKHYQHPKSYIRFSSTVEDCIGHAYCMNEEDGIFLRSLNVAYKSHAEKRRCSEEQFEEVMSFFEETCSDKQPYATLDNAPVLSYNDMEAEFNETISDSCRLHAKDIYEHWKTMRTKSLNHPLMPSLRFERNTDTDETDPFVCFRRREVRQARKTRGRDAQTVEKIKKLRTELEQSRLLIHLTRDREMKRLTQTKLDRKIFQQRHELLQTKRSLGIKGDEDLLVNQKPVEKAPRLDLADRRGSGLHLKASIRPEGRIQESDLLQLSDERKRRDAEVEAVIQESMTKHRNWNNGWVDNTWRPITPPLESSLRNAFRTAITEFLPTPPPSASLERPLDDGRVVSSHRRDEQVAPFRYDSPPLELHAPRPSFRRRLGRGGRLWIDRRNMSKPNMSEEEEDDEEMSDYLRERYEYDVDSDEDSKIYHIDPWDDMNMRYRINYSVMPSARDPETQRKLQAEQQRRINAASNTGNTVNSSSNPGNAPQIPLARAA